MTAKLAIEIDGASHQARQRRDRLRDTFFRKRGIVVLRFTNHEALHQTAAVLEAIRAARQPISPLTK